MEDGFSTMSCIETFSNVVWVVVKIGMRYDLVAKTSVVHCTALYGICSVRN